MNQPAVQETKKFWVLQTSNCVPIAETWATDDEIKLLSISGATWVCAGKQPHENDDGGVLFKDCTFIEKERSFWRSLMAK
jgi:hypothetical protein